MSILRILNVALEVLIALFVLFLLFGVWLVVAPLVITNFGLFVMILPALLIGLLVYASLKFAKEKQFTKTQTAKHVALAATLGFIGGLFIDMMAASMFLGDFTLVVDLVQKQIETGLQSPVYEKFYFTR